MRLFISTALVVCVSSITLAHHPDKENQKVHPRIEVIPPLGNALPMSHRRKYNRPSNWMGKIAYHIAPSSQEAMAWHNATHRGYYENKSPRMVTHYFYPKPWEGLRIGPRRATTAGNSQQSNLDVPTLDIHPLDDPAEALDPAEVIPPPTAAELDIPPAPLAEKASEAVPATEDGVEPGDKDESEATESPSDLTPPNVEKDLPNVDDSAAEGINPPLTNEPATAE